MTTPTAKAPVTREVLRQPMRALLRSTVWCMGMLGLVAVVAFSLTDRRPSSSNAPAAIMLCIALLPWVLGLGHSCARQIGWRLRRRFLLLLGRPKSMADYPWPPADRPVGPQWPRHGLDIARSVSLGVAAIAFVIIAIDPAACGILNPAKPSKFLGIPLTEITAPILMGVCAMLSAGLAHWTWHTERIRLDTWWFRPRVRWRAVPIPDGEPCRCALEIPHYWRRDERTEWSATLSVSCEAAGELQEVQLSTTTFQCTTDGLAEIELDVRARSLPIDFWGVICSYCELKIERGSGDAEPRWSFVVPIMGSGESAPA